MEEKNEDRVQSLWSSFKQDVVQSKPPSIIQPKVDKPPEPISRLKVYLDQFSFFCCSLIIIFSGSFSNSSSVNAPSSSTIQKPTDIKRPFKTGGLSGFANQVSAKKQKVQTTLLLQPFNLNTQIISLITLKNMFIF